MLIPPSNMGIFVKSIVIHTLWSLVAAHIGQHNELEAFHPEDIVLPSETLLQQLNCTLSVAEPSGPQPSITVDAQGGYVTVQWTCDTLLDRLWIGAYSPPPTSFDDLKNRFPMRLSFDLTSSSGSVRMRFGNYRAPLQFVMLQGGNYYLAPCCPVYITNCSTIVSFALDRSCR